MNTRLVVGGRYSNLLIYLRAHAVRHREDLSLRLHGFESRDLAPVARNAHQQGRYDGAWFYDAVLRGRPWSQGLAGWYRDGLFWCRFNPGGVPRWQNNRPVRFLLPAGG